MAEAHYYEGRCNNIADAPRFKHAVVEESGRCRWCGEQIHASYGERLQKIENQIDQLIANQVTLKKTFVKVLELVGA